MSSSRHTAAGPRRPAVTVVALLIALTLLAAGLRTFSLADDNLWRDEGASLLLSGAPGLGEVISQTIARDPHPPGYYLTLHLWRGVFGSSDAAVRALSVLLGTLAVPAIFLVGRALFGTSVGLGAAALMAAMPASLRYSQEARSYAMLSLLMILAWYFAVRLTNGRDRSAAVGYAIVAVVLPYTHYWGGPVLLATSAIPAIILVSDRKHLARLRQFVPGVVIAGGAFAPWVAIIVRHQLDVASRGTFAPHVSLSSLLGAFGRPFGYDLLFGPMGTLAVFTGLACAALVLWLWRAGQADESQPAEHAAAWWCIGMLLIPLAAIAAIGEVTTFWIGVRVPNITMVPTAVICSAAVAGLWRRHKAAGVVLSCVLVVLCVNGIWRWYTAPKRPNWEAMAAVVEAEERPGDVVVTIDANFVPELFDHYYSGALPVRGLSRWIMDRETILDRARELWPKGGRMWLILANPHDSPAPQILRDLAPDEKRYRIRDMSLYRLDYPPPDRWKAVASSRHADPGETP